MSLPLENVDSYESLLAEEDQRITSGTRQSASDYTHASRSVLGSYDVVSTSFMRWCATNAFIAALPKNNAGARIKPARSW